MSRPRRVILDTSTLVSSVLGIGSVPERAVLRAFESCKVCACAETLEELEIVLARKKFDRYLDEERRRAFVARIRRNSHIQALQHVAGQVFDPPCRDKNDEKFLALALAASADTIVSGDRNLLELNPWRGIAILTPAEFLAQFDRASESDAGG